MEGPHPPSFFIEAALLVTQILMVIPLRPEMYTTNNLKKIIKEINEKNIVKFEYKGT
jgi:hypothetical protein